MDNWGLLKRFLILGSEGGTYYVNERSLTRENARNVVACIKENGEKVVNLILDISTNARAPKQDPAIFALALCCAEGDPNTKRLAYNAISQVCRTGTTMFMFLQNIQDLRGWSAGLRRGVSNFYLGKSNHQVDLQMVKYRERNGFTHRDALRLAHPATNDSLKNELFKYAVGKGEAPVGTLLHTYESLKHLNAGSPKDVARVVRAISETGLPREGVPNEFLNSREVWEALLEQMPVTAMVRNLGKMSQVGLTNSNMSSATKKVVEVLSNAEILRKSRIHPSALLIAQKQYAQGHGNKGSLTWTTVPNIIKALDDAFYASFGYIEPTGLNYMLGVDVSPSMHHWTCAGTDVLKAAEGAAVMAMVTARVEKNYDIHGFTHKFVDLKISPNDSLETVCKKAYSNNFGSTNCGQPIEYALKNKIKVDCFNIYTDNESNYGEHPKTLIDRYRQKTGIPAKLVGISFAATRTSLIDPKDMGMLDLVGFDAATPKLIAEFSKGL